MTFKRNFRCPAVSLADSNIRIFEKCRHWKRWSYRQRDGDTLPVEGVHFSFGAFPCRAWLRDAICTMQRHVWTGVALKRHSTRIRTHTHTQNSANHSPSVVVTDTSQNCLPRHKRDRRRFRRQSGCCETSSILQWFLLRVYTYREIVTRSFVAQKRGAMKISVLQKKKGGESSTWDMAFIAENCGI